MRRSCPIDPNRASTKMPPATIRLRGLPDVDAWTNAHSMKAVFIGWRVIANTPLGVPIAAGPAPGWGKAGLRRSEPMKRIEATSISADPIGHQPAGATHSGARSSPAR
ncbi:hypothetical protein GCM10023232_12650 [Sphingosinicella ginsenosidimutans]